MSHDHNHNHSHDHESEEMEEYQPTTFAGKVGRWIWNIVFGMMYPVLVIFAFIVTAIIKLSSLLSNLIVWVISKFRK